MLNNFCIDFKRIKRNIINSSVKYMYTNKIKAMVLGMSGGIDSTLTAALASEVSKKLNIPLIGQSINIRSKQAEIERGLDASKVFCTSFNHINLDHVLESMIKEYNSISEYKSDIKTLVRIGNLKARIRMTYLYDMAQHFDGLVLSTDNYTEFLLGFWTLHGDVGDFGMIQSLWKTEVYGLTEYLMNSTKDNRKKTILKDAINAVPTDGLGITDSDFDQICKNVDQTRPPRDLYRYVDLVLSKHIENKFDKHTDNPIIKRHIKSNFKRNNPFNLLRTNII